VLGATGGMCNHASGPQCINLYHPDLIPHLQRHAPQYLAMQHLCMGSTMGNMQVGYLSCVTNVWLTYKNSYKGFVCRRPRFHYLTFYLTLFHYKQIIWTTLSLPWRGSKVSMKSSRFGWSWTRLGWMKSAIPPALRAAIRLYNSLPSSSQFLTVTAITCVVTY